MHIKPMPTPFKLLMHRRRALLGGRDGSNL